MKSFNRLNVKNVLPNLDEKAVTLYMSEQSTTVLNSLNAKFAQQNLAGIVHLTYTSMLSTIPLSLSNANYAHPHLHKRVILNVILK
jgi:hypothetical protein